PISFELIGDCLAFMRLKSTLPLASLLKDFHPYWFLDRRLDGYHSTPFCRPFENIQEPRIADPKGRKPGALGKQKKQKEDLTTERDSSYHEVVVAAGSSDNSQLKGIYRAPKPRGRKRKAAEDISSQAPASKAVKKPIAPKKTVKKTAVM